MVQLTRIYTKGGDKGKTSLGDGSRVSKSDPLINAIGAVDETNSAIGLAAALLTNAHQEALIRIQHDLFDVGADLCVPLAPENKQKLRVTNQQVTRIEQELDALNVSLAPLDSFVLPGGSIQSGHIHMARTFTRRAERAICTLTNVNEAIIIYMNRLSDYLFVLARTVNDQGKLDVLWVPGKNQ